MEDFKNIPMGLSMSLSSNADALAKFKSMNDEQRTELLSRATKVNSKKEMSLLVKELTNEKFF